MLWGVYYGVLLILEKFLFRKVKAVLPKAVNIIVTLFFVLIGWCLFYFTDMSQALTRISHMFGIGADGWLDATSLFQIKRNLGLLIVSVLVCIPWPEIFKSGEKGKTSKLFTTSFLIKDAAAQLYNEQ